MHKFYMTGIIIVVLAIGAIFYFTNSNIKPSNQEVMTTDEAQSAQITPEDDETKVDEEEVLTEGETENGPEETQVEIVVPEPPTADPPEFSGAIIKTSLGDITVSFYGSDSPMTVNNFTNLAGMGFYDNTLFHRVIPDFMVQAGDPLSRLPDKTRHGTGGPGYTFADEFNARPLVLGSLAMANAGPDTNGSQFFIVTAEATPWLDGRHTNFGEVTDGMDIVLQIQGVERDARDNPVEAVEIIGVELVK